METPLKGPLSIWKKLLFLRLIYKFPLLKSFEASPSFGDIVTGCVEYLKHDIHSVVCIKKKLIINKTNFFLS